MVRQPGTPAWPGEHEKWRTGDHRLAGRRRVPLRCHRPIHV